MKSFFKEGARINFQGFKGVIIQITETYRKNVLVVKIEEYPAKNPFAGQKVEKIGLFEHPDGNLEFMSIID
jgi:hypothetical protein